MPLVDYNYDSLFTAAVDLLEQILISFVDKNALEFREINVKRLNVPVHEIRVKTFFSELVRFTVVQTHVCFVSFHLPSVVSPVHYSFVNVVRNVHPSFMQQSSPS